MEVVTAAINQVAEELKADQPYTKIVNLCPHAVNLVFDTGASLTFEASGMVARVETVKSLATRKLQLAPGLVMDLHLQQQENIRVINLPDPEEGTLYLVSTYVASFFGSARSDLISPTTDSTALRDKAGKVVGVKDFTRFV